MLDSKIYNKLQVYDAVTLSYDRDVAYLASNLHGYKHDDVDNFIIKAKALDPNLFGQSEQMRRKEKLIKEVKHPSLSLGKD